MTELPSYTTHGTIHIVANNQVPMLNSFVTVDAPKIGLSICVYKLLKPSFVLTAMIIGSYTFKGSWSPIWDLTQRA
jgi:hypothetical protein